jgi:hypothetical protein
MGLLGWRYKRELIIDYTKIDSDLTDFPVLVKLNSTNFDFSKAQSNGYDIRFVLEDGTLLSYERERHDSSNEKAEYWVKIPNVSSSEDTMFYMYYNNPFADDGANPTNVWDSNYKGVYHLNQDPSGTAPQIKDSTTNYNDGTSNGSMTSDDLVEGQIDGALDFDGSNDYIEMGGDEKTSSLAIQNICTYEVWFKSFEDKNANIISQRENYPSHGRGISLNTSNIVMFWSRDGGDNWKDVTTTYTLNTWIHVVGTQDNDVISIYVNGNFIGSLTMSGNIGGRYYSYHRIGDYTDDSLFFNGIIDEVRISNVVRSSAYIKATYNSDMNTLLTIGDEQLNITGDIVWFGANF